MKNKMYYVEVGGFAFSTSYWTQKQYNAFVKLCKDHCETDASNPQSLGRLTVWELKNWSEELRDNKCHATLIKIYPDTVLNSHPCHISEKIIAYAEQREIERNGERPTLFCGPFQILKKIESLATTVDGMAAITGASEPTGTKEKPKKPKGKPDTVKSESGKPTEKKTRNIDKTTLLYYPDTKAFLDGKRNAFEAEETKLNVCHDSSKDSVSDFSLETNTQTQDAVQTCADDYIKQWEEIIAIKPKTVAEHLQTLTKFAKDNLGTLTKGVGRSAAWAEFVTWRGTHLATYNKGIQEVKKTLDKWTNSKGLDGFRVAHHESKMSHRAYGESMEQRTKTRKKNAEKRAKDADKDT